MPHSEQTTHHSWIYRRAVLPILALLRMGASPRSLAWSIAVGLVIGVNPLLGSTTIISLAIALAFRLNVVASQVANHAAWLLELALVVPFIRLGARVFGTPPLPMSRHEFIQAARTAPMALTRQLWLWEWHALVVWGAIALVAMPAIALALTPVLERIDKRIQRHEYPVVPAL
jgi:hypothetical protein